MNMHGEGDTQSEKKEKKKERIALTEVFGERFSFS